MARLDLDSISVGIAIVIAVALLVMYFVMRARERGHSPRFAKEVYLYYDPATPAPDPGRVAAIFAAELATPGQVTEYAAVGGAAHGYGATSGGQYLALMPVGLGAALAVTPFPRGAPPAYGVWLYGPKPRRGTKGITPFGCDGEWFQPSDR
jgi:hypothetical protein